MGYLSLTDADRAEMLAAIGVSSIDELFEQIPPGVRFDRELDVPPALGEAELVRHLEELAAQERPHGRRSSRSSAPGIYDHYVPSVADVVFSRGEFLTAYTPYQPEMSQGTLQAIFEYQTVICELTGMDVSNASGYDGCTVAADACFVARHVSDRRKVVLAETLNPQVRQVVKTYAPGFGFEVVEVPHRGGVIDPDELASGLGGRGRGVLPAAELPRMPRGRAGTSRQRRTRPRARCPSRTSTSCRSACSRRRAHTAARSRSARGSRRGTGRRTAARTTASWRRAATTCVACRAASSARPSTRTAAARSCSPSRRASSTSGARRRPRTSRRTRRCSRSAGSRRCRGSGRRGCKRSGETCLALAAVRA